MGLEQIANYELNKYPVIKNGETMLSIIDVYFIV